MDKTKVDVEREFSLDPSAVCQEIEDFIRMTLTALHREGAVIGLSGGLDSAVTTVLAVRSLGAQCVHLLNLPERDSKPIHRSHAKLLADYLGIPLIVKNIAPILKATGTYRMLPLRFIPSRRLRSALVTFAKNHFNIATDNLLATRLQAEGGTWVAKGTAYALAKHRIRMVLVYQYAEIHNLMVVGAANRTEWLTGTFSKWGVDHCADMMPLLHIYRSQLEQLAQYLAIPEVILNKAADPDIMPGVNDKGALLGNFIEVDRILYGLEHGVDVNTLYEMHGEEKVDQILNLQRLSTHMRESPYHISTEESL